MPGLVNIDFDTREVSALANRLVLFGPNVRAKAMGRGLSKVGKQGAVSLKQGIAKEYNVKAADVAKRMTVVSQRAGMRVEIRARARNARSNRIPLLQFGAKESKGKGVTFTIRKGAGKTRLRHAFIATMPNGKTGVFERVPGRHSIKEVLGIDITHMMVGKRVLPTAMKKIKDNMNRVVIHELEWELRKVGFK